LVFEVSEAIAEIQGDCAFRAGSEAPLIAAMHATAAPAALIETIRAGSSEFLSLPARPGIFDALDRVTMLVESRAASARTRKNGGLIVGERRIWSDHSGVPSGCGPEPYR